MEKFQSAAVKPYYEVKQQLHDLSTQKKGIFTSIIMPSLDRSLEVEAMVEAGDADAQLAVAMTRYRLDHGQLPRQLAALVPNYLDEIPIDPFNGQSLRLTTRNGEWIIYSVGANGIDNGGKSGAPSKDEDDVSFTFKSMKTTTHPTTQPSKGIY
jgi:hypothetical protein